MTGALVFRNMTKDDWEEFHVFDLIVFPSDTMAKEAFMRGVERGSFFALRLAGNIIGQLFLSPFGEDEGYIGRIAISPEHQGKGYGKGFMSHAIKWLKNQGIRKAHLYTQDHNERAQALYKQFGFKKSGSAWHYFVPLASLCPSGHYSCTPIRSEEIDIVGKKYQSLPAKQIRHFLKSSEHLVFTLKNNKEVIIGACRFTPSFPGCFPFEIEDTSAFDDFLHGLKPHASPEFDYIRIVLQDNDKLAEVCQKRGYRLHHRLIKMTANIS